MAPFHHHEPSATEAVTGVSYQELFAQCVLFIN